MYDYFMENELYQKLLQLFILGYEGETPPQKLISLIENGLGGVIFFAENLKNRKEFINITEKLKVSAQIPLFLSVDQEGGLVERTIFLDKRVEYLTPKALSRLNKTDIKIHYDILSKDLVSMGLNLNFAPVVDVNSNPKNPIIGVRSFGNTPDIVNKNAKIVINSFNENGIISCAKHYPGHGDTLTDSHKVMPCVDMDFDEFYKTHLICFEEAVKNNVDTVMVSHVHFPFFDEKPTPSSLSKNAINYLKNELKFEGIIFSDDMVMGGISQNYGLQESIILALKAGIDTLIFRNTTDELTCAIKEIAAITDKELKNAIERAYEKVICFKKSKLVDNKPFEFDTLKNQKGIDKIALKTPKIIKNNGILPLTNGSKITVLSFDNSEIFNLSTINSNLSDYLDGYNPTEIKYPVSPAREDIKKILKQLNNDDTVIFLSYNPTLNKGQNELFKAITSRKILIHCGIEDCNTQTGNAESIILASCYNTPALKALADILIKPCN